MSYEMNRKANARNEFQGERKRVLCVCSAGLLRSPTAALVLANEFNCNTRAAGMVPQFALIPVDEVLLHWADEVVCMERDHEHDLQEMGCKKPIICLDIQDSFAYRDDKLMWLIKEKYAAALEKVIV